MYARCCAAAVALTEGAAVTAKPAGPVPNAIYLPPNSICPSSLAPSRAECTGNASTDDASARPATLAPLVKHVSLLSRPSLVVFFPLSLHLWIVFGLFTPTSPWPTISWLLMEEFPFFPPPTAVTSQHKDEEIRERKAKKKESQHAENGRKFVGKCDLLRPRRALTARKRANKGNGDFYFKFPILSARVIRSTKKSL